MAKLQGVKLSDVIKKKQTSTTSNRTNTQSNRTNTQSNRTSNNDDDCADCNGCGETISNGCTGCGCLIIIILALIWYFSK